MHNYRPADIQSQVCVLEAFRNGILRDPYFIYLKKIINNRINANVCVEKNKLNHKNNSTPVQYKRYTKIPCFFLFHFF